MLHNLKVIHNLSPNPILALGQLLHIPKMRIPALHIPIPLLQQPSLHPKRHAAPNPPTEICRQSRLINGYPAPIALDPVLLRQLPIRNLLYRMVYAAGRVAIRVVRAEDGCGEIRGGGVVRHEFCVAGVEGGDAVGEEDVGGEAAGYADQHAEEALRA